MKKCPFCNEEVPHLKKHLRQNHPKEYRIKFKQEKKKYIKKSLESDLLGNKNFLNMYKKILSISTECTILKRNYNIFHQAELDWDENQKCWIIFHQDRGPKFFLIHELGHIYLAKKKINYLGFA